MLDLVFNKIELETGASADNAKRNSVVLDIYDTDTLRQTLPENLEEQETNHYNTWLLHYYSLKQNSNPSYYNINLDYKETDGERNFGQLTNNPLNLKISENFEEIKEKPWSFGIKNFPNYGIYGFINFINVESEEQESSEGEVTSSKVNNTNVRTGILLEKGF